jgi:hypothetical protein
MQSTSAITTAVVQKSMAQLLSATIFQVQAKVPGADLVLGASAV